MGGFTVKECLQHARDCADAARAATEADRKRLFTLADDWMILASAVRMEHPLRVMGLSVCVVTVAATS